MEPTDWTEDIVERFTEVDVEDNETVVHQRFSRAVCALCRYIVEPVALRLAEQDDWLDLGDVRALTGYQMTASVATWRLVGELHAGHPPVRGDDHHARVDDARRSLHSMITRHVREAVDAGELQSRVLSSVEH